MNAAARRVVLSIVLVAFGGARAGAEEKGSLPQIEGEFKAAIKKVTPATVLCYGKGAPKFQRERGASSGVIVSRKGLVLTDADATMLLKVSGEGNKQRIDRTDVDEVEVRVPDVDKKTFKAYTARVVRKVRDADSCLLRILDPPSGGFTDALTMGPSDDLSVGDFAFAMGNSFGLSDEALPSLTAGVVAALVPTKPGSAEGRWETIYTTAAVNPGVNGGPLVDIEGRLIGTVSTFMLPEPSNPFQFLGKVVPVQRLRALYGDIAEAAEMFPAVKPVKARSKQSAALESTFAHAARVAGPSVVSLTIERSKPLAVVVPVGPGQTMPVARYTGPASGIVVNDQGEIVTSLYSLANVAGLLYPEAPGEPRPDILKLETGLAGIVSAKATFPDGRTLPAKLLGADPRRGIALFRAEGFRDAGYAWRALEPVPAERFEEGRFVVALGNPYGEKPLDAPLLAVGMLSKQHAATAPSPWRGDWQTDAGVTDANAGGAAVDLQGRVYGMLRLWSPLQHGRSSGIGFLLPWASIQEALPDLRAGRTWKRGYMGITWKRKTDIPTVEEVAVGSPAALAGFQPEDVVKALDGEAIESIPDALRLLRFRWEGEQVRVVVARTVAKKPQEVELKVTLGPRPEPPAPPPAEPAPEKPADKPPEKPSEKPAEKPPEPAPSEPPPEPVPPDDPKPLR